MIPPLFLPRVVRSSHSSNKLGLNGAGDERGDGERMGLKKRSESKIMAILKSH